LIIASAKAKLLTAIGHDPVLPVRALASESAGPVTTNPTS
jgi:hypothetical protein